MKRSLCTEMFFTEVPFEERFRPAREAGFDYIEFWSWADKDIPAIKELCSRYDLGIASFSGQGSFPSAGPLKERMDGELGKTGDQGLRLRYGKHPDQ